VLIAICTWRFSEQGENMRKYSQKLINEFKAVYNEKTSRKISDAEANQKLGTLANLVKTIALNSKPKLSNVKTRDEQLCQN